MSSSKDHEMYVYEDLSYSENEFDEIADQSEAEEDDDELEYSGSQYDDIEEVRAPQVNYIILSEEVILRKQKKSVADVCAVLSIPASDAMMLLRHYKWSVPRVEDEWFQDESAVRRAVGLPSRETDSSEDSDEASDSVVCGVCFESYSIEHLDSPLCGEHFLCSACWKGYIANAINEGPGCLTLRCSDPSCGAVVGEEVILKHCSNELKAKYKRYQLRSFVEDNKMVKWCPAPGCDFAVEFFPGSDMFDVVCNCGFVFCFNCLEEGHRPVDCDTVAKWILKNSAESENMNWILANSKPCPKCKRPIEKNQGCMHMSCTPPCKHEFCWLCLGTWSEHSEKTGGFYACNRYEADKNQGKLDETERRRDMAKSLLERYTHYYERWASNEQSRIRALESLRLLQSSKLEELANRQGQPASQLKFVLEGQNQIIECRRLLKWTYAYGYYLPPHEVNKRVFFEYLQGEAEAALERLHNCAEKEIEGFFSNSNAELAFNEFRTKLAGLTSVTRTFFKNLVEAMEKGLVDVQTNPELPAQSSSAQQAAGRSRSKRQGKNAKVGSSSSL